MKRTILIVSCVLLAASVQAATLKMPPAPEIDLEGPAGEITHPLTAGLFVPSEVRSEIFVVKTSPFDKMKYPVGEYTVDLFERNLPQVFAEVVKVEAQTSSDVDFVIEVAIVRFDAKIPHPAYNPYTATMVYKLTARDAAGETLFVQTVTGDGQTSKGMMSGFKAKGLAAESAARAMTDAGRQALEALAEAPELTEVEKDEPVPSQSEN